MRVLALLVFTTALLLWAAPCLAAGLDSPEYEDYQASFRCAPLAPKLLEKLRGRVSVKGDTLHIRADNGRKTLFKSFLNDDGPYDQIIVYCIADYVEPLDLLLVNYGYYEDGGYACISLRTGKKAFFNGSFTLSPDRKRILHDTYDHGGRDDIRIYRLTEKGPVLEFQQHSDRVLQECAITWSSNSALNVIYASEYPPFLAGKHVGRIVQEGQRWTFEQAPDYTKALALP